MIYNYLFLILFGCLFILLLCKYLWVDYFNLFRISGVAVVSGKSIGVWGPDAGQCFVYSVNCAFRKLAEKEHNNQLLLIRILCGAVDTTKSICEVFKCFEFFEFLVAAKTSFLVENIFRILPKVGNSYIWWWHNC